MNLPGLPFPGADHCHRIYEFTTTPSLSIVYLTYLKLGQHMLLVPRTAAKAFTRCLRLQNKIRSLGTYLVEFARR